MSGLFIILFLVFFGVVLLACGLALRVLETTQQRKVEQVVKTVASQTLTVTTSNKASIRLQTSPTSTWLLQFPPFAKLETAIRCAALDWSVDMVALAMMVLALIGAFVGSRFHPLVPTWMGVAAFAGLFGAAPVLQILRKRSARLAEFERQFPEGLDFLARSVRAGHGLSISVELLAHEAAEPMSTEFRRLANELNLGLAFDVALKNLVARLPLVNVRLFVSAVLLQRETGGNLAEILTNIATLIRARFQLRNQVMALTAQGRITPLVLTVLPILIAIGMSVVAPDYLPSMLPIPPVAASRSEPSAGRSRAT